jgi:SAM-dependent methyltransferase
MVRRLKGIPGAMTMKGWENHFEWLHFMQFLDTRDPTKILDFGCGCGHSDVFLAIMGHVVHGYDVDPLALSIAQYVRSLQEYGVQGRVTFSDQPPSWVPDVVWMSHTLEHIHVGAWPSIFGALNHHLVYISVPLGHGYDDPSHVNHWEDEAALERDLQANGAVVNDLKTDFVSWVIRAWVSTNST